MDTCVAFLSGINVGRRRVKGPELVAIFADLGLHDARTFLASGNVVFASADPVGNALVERIEQGLADALGYEVVTHLRTAGEVRTLAAREPFTPDELEAAGGKPQVGFLRAEPDGPRRVEALALAPEGDRLHVQGREVHWLPNGGLARSELDMAALRRLVGPMTLRTADTVRRIVATFL